MSVPDRPTRQQAAASIAGRIDWTPTYLAEFGERAAIVEQVLRLAEYESAAEVRALRAETERKVSIDVRMERPPAPDWGGEEDDDGVQLYHHAWESTDEMLRLWVGPYAVGDSGPWWAVTVNAPGIDLVMRCTPDEVVEWADMVKEAVTDGPALLARTPQPDEVDAVRAELYEFAPPPWEAINYEVHAGGELLFEALGERSHEENSRIADVVVRFFNAAAPLPAVPDGEDALEPDAADPDDVRQALRAALRGRDEAADEVEQLRDQLDRAHALNRKQHRELVELTMVPPPPFGEDVPARLDAAADALAAFPDDINAKQARRHLRRAADWLNVPSPGPVRAAVAAALARPTERER